MISIEVKSSLMEVTREFTSPKKAEAFLKFIKRHHIQHNKGAKRFLKVNISTKENEIHN